MVRTKLISWWDAIKLGIFIGLVGFLLFMIIQVIWAQILKDTLVEYYESGLLIGLLILIILVGFLISIIISLIASVIISKMVIRKYITYAILFSFIINILFWIILSYTQIMIYYPEIVQNLTGFEKLIAIPRIIAYFGIYRLSSVTLLWALNQATFAFFFVIILKILRAKKIVDSYNYDDKIKL